MSLIFCSIFYFGFNWTMGAVHWFYMAEVLTDRQFGFIACSHYSGGLFLSLTSESMLDLLTPPGLFTMLSIIMVIASWFTCRFMKETRGLTDGEKKTLYMPKQTETEVQLINQSEEEARGNSVQ